MTIEAKQADAAVTVQAGTELFDFRGTIAADGEPRLEMKPTDAEQWSEVGRTIKRKAIQPNRPDRKSVV